VKPDADVLRRIDGGERGEEADIVEIATFEQGAIMIALSLSLPVPVRSVSCPSAAFRRAPAQVGDLETMKKTKKIRKKKRFFFLFFISSFGAFSAVCSACAADAPPRGLQRSGALH
jgi:hypothetical protein